LSEKRGCLRTCVEVVELMFLAFGDQGESLGVSIEVVGLHRGTVSE
jgi:hypothetical protein